MSLSLVTPGTGTLHANNGQSTQKMPVSGLFPFYLSHNIFNGGNYGGQGHSRRKKNSSNKRGSLQMMIFLIFQTDLDCWSKSMFSVFFTVGLPQLITICSICIQACFLVTCSPATVKPTGFFFQENDFIVSLSDHDNGHPMPGFNSISCHLLVTARIYE